MAEARKWISGEKGYRWWLDSEDCDHIGNNVCKFCDHDGYYAQTYESVPWRQTVGDASHWSDGTAVDPAELAANHDQAAQ